MIPKDCRRLAEVDFPIAEVSKHAARGKILPKLRSGSDLRIGVDFSVTVNNDVARNLASDLRQILDDLGLADKVQIRDS